MAEGTHSMSPGWDHKCSATGVSDCNGEQG